MWTTRTVFGLAVLAIAAAHALAQVGFPESEPNESKAAATDALNMQPGDFLTGTTTGALATGGVASVDYFHVKMAAAPSNLYRYQLVVTSATPGHIISIRGVTQANGTPTTTDVAFQTSLTTTTPGRMVQWYGFGLQEELYISISGAAATTAPYTATLVRDTVTPVDMVGTVTPGDVTIVADTATANTFDTDWWLYGPGFVAAPTFGHDEVDNTPVTRTLAPGTYYLAGGLYNSANNLGNPADDAFRLGNLLDFPNCYASSSTSTLTTTMTYNVTSAAGTISASGNRAGAFDVVWYRFVVAPSQNPVAAGWANPVGGLNDGTTTIHFTVNVIPGINPPSTGISVFIDLSSIGGPSNAQMFDDGAHGDGGNRDNSFGLNFTIPTGTAAGTYSIPFGIADAQGRSGGGVISNFTIVVPPVLDFDFGDLSVPTSATQVFDLASGSARWFKFRLSAPVDAASGTFVDLDTENSNCADTELGVYRIDGSLINSDDDDGSGLQSQFSFGAGIRPAVTACTGASAPYNGRDGTLPAGTYYVAAAQFNATFTNGFGVTSTGAGASGINLNIRSRVDPLPPTAAPATRTVLLDGAAVDTILSVAVTPGAFPTSTDLTVTVNAAALGGGGALALRDDGVAPDAAAGDRIFSAGLHVASSTGAGQYLLPFTVADAQSRSATGNITVNVIRPLFDFGDMSSPPRAVTRALDIPAGGPVWLKFSLSQGVDAGMGNFLDMDTENSGCADTELGLYAADGTLLVTDDDDASGQQSQLSFGLGGRPAVNTGCAGAGVAYNGRDGALNPGSYYVAVAQFNATFTSGFGATSTGSGLSGVNFNIRSFIDPVAPSATATVTPTSVINDGLGSAVIRVAVTPGVFPPSTSLSTRIGPGSVGGSSSLQALDDGNDPDLIAGDNVFSVRVPISAGFAAGDYALDYAVTDAENRSATGTINLSVIDAMGACCQPSGCTFILRTDCLAAGGNFLGHNTPCISGDGFDIASAGVGAFEDIGATGTLLTLDDDSNANIPIGFTFRFYGVDYTDCFVASNGYVSFGAGYDAFTNVPIPAGGIPNNALYGFWDDLNPGGAGSVAYETRGVAGSGRRLIVQWTGVPQFNLTDSNTFQIVLFENGNAEFRYGAISAPVAGDVTIGAENLEGTAASSYDATLLGAGNTGLRLVFRIGSNACGPPCRIDFNQDGDVNADDLSDYITCYFSLPACSDADFNGADGINADDLSDFITAYFTGC